MKNRLLTIIPMIILAAWIFSGCQSSTEPEKMKGSVTGIVQAGNEPVSPAYLISDNKLLAVTESDGSFSIDEITEGTVTIICSALNFSDAVIDIKVAGNETVTQNCTLTADKSTGRDYGEFQDQTLIDYVLSFQPEIGNWNGKEIFEGTTGATLQTKWLPFTAPECTVYLGDTPVAYADAFGQFWTKLQSGTYPLTGKAEGYDDAIVIVQIIPDDKAYTSFNLARK